MKKHFVVGATILFSLAFLSGCLGSEYIPNDNPGNNPEDPYDPGIPDDSNPDPIDEPPSDVEDPIDDDGDVIPPENDIDMNEVNLEIVTNDNDIRYWDKVIYTVIGAPSSSNITWDFDDGNITYGEEVIHRYESSDYFTITVTATLNDESAETTMDLAVKNKDDAFVMESTSTKLVLGSEGNAIGIVVPEGITIPSSHLYINFTKLTGELEVGVCIYQRINGERILFETLTSDIFEGKLSYYNFEWEIFADDIAHLEDIRPYEVSCFARWSGLAGYTEYTMSIFIEY